MVDADGNVLDLEQYNISSSGVGKNSFYSVLPNADKYVTLPSTADHKSIELISDYGINFAIYSGATLLMEVEGVTNFILKGTLNYTCFYYHDVFQRLVA